MFLLTVITERKNALKEKRTPISWPAILCSAFGIFLNLKLFTLCKYTWGILLNLTNQVLLCVCCSDIKCECELSIKIVQMLFIYMLPQTYTSIGFSFFFYLRYIDLNMKSSMFSTIQLVSSYSFKNSSWSDKSSNKHDMLMKTRS
jgi:hypothetical protein